MKGLASLSLKTEYRKGRDDIACSFYLPCMEVADRYDRAVGFFNSTIYVIAWPSLKDFVARNSKMRLISSPILTPSDIEAIEHGYSERFERENGEYLRDEIRNMLTMPEFYKPVKVLATLVALEVVDIRIAFMKKPPERERLFHDKLGIFHDGFGNTVVFKGSMNETWSGLSADGNLESVDVFLSWEHAREASRVKENEEYFDALWNNEYEGVKVRNFPDIARSELVKASDIKNWPDLVDEICNDIEAAKKFNVHQIPGSRVLRPHQSEALKNWETQGRRGILEHATGSGKTFTAINAIRDALRLQEVPLILVPSELLLNQWFSDLSKSLPDLQSTILRCGAGHSKWRDNNLIGSWTRKGSVMQRIVLSTMQTAASPEFMNSIRQGNHIFLVSDEVHRIGSTKHLQLLSLDSGPRLGLSATPRRAGDPEGTARILDYFNGIVSPPFTLQDAINSGVLTPYFYYVHTVNLTHREQERWDEISNRIRRLSARNASDTDANSVSIGQIEMLLIERSRILKQAEGKVAAATRILRDQYKQGDRWIVYCDNLEQLADVQTGLSEIGIKSMQYHSSMSGDKKQTISLFEANGGIIVSIRCLDEGVDIPSVTHALILASSKNPREYIQRRGRVLRRAEGKSFAAIHDVLVLPIMKETTNESEDPRLSILEGEIVRSIEFGRSALNPAVITNLELIALEFTKDYKTFMNAGYEEEEE